MSRLCRVVPFAAIAGLNPDLYIFLGDNISSIQVIPEFSGWESWSNVPFEKQRLFDLIANKAIEGVIFISGDRHFAEISVLRREGGYPLYELTSSALNLRHPSGQTGYNEFRIDGTYLRENFGEIRIR